MKTFQNINFKILLIFLMDIENSLLPFTKILHGNNFGISDVRN